MNVWLACLLGVSFSLISIVQAGGYSSSRDETSSKPGTCPTRDSCKDLCQDDDDCKGKKKCCDDGCQKSCVKPKKAICKYGGTGEKCGGKGHLYCKDAKNTSCKFKSFFVIETDIGECCYRKKQKSYKGGQKPGTCPAPKTCKDKCTSDKKCRSKKKCCNDGCRKVCTNPVTEKPKAECTYADKKYKDGKAIMIAHELVCGNRCWCDDGDIKCNNKQCDKCKTDGKEYYPGRSAYNASICSYCTCNPDSTWKCGANLCVHQKCVYGERRYDHGDTWDVDCNACTCDEGKVECTEKECNKGKRDGYGGYNPYATYDAPKTCRRYGYGKEYQPGDKYFSTSRCNYCECQDTGEFKCGPDICETSCKDYDGKEREDGDKWKHDCNSCYCKKGEVTCTSIPCFEVCKVPGSDDKEYRGEKYFDGCNECTCGDKGIWACTKKACPCKHPKTGSTYNSGDRYTKDPCNNCTCRSNGQWDCTDNDCEDCTHPETGAHHPPGYSYNDGCNDCRCLSTGGWGCTKKACPCKHPSTGAIYRSGDSYQEDACNNCTCRSNGQWDCTDQDCRCKHPSTGNMYNSGYSYARDHCNNCTCRSNGQWDCSDNDCNECKRPDTGDYHSPGYEYNDGCNDCMCQRSGQWACTEKACLCEHPVSGAMHNPGYSYPRDACNKCTCLPNGQWDCSDVECNDCFRPDTGQSHPPDFVYVDICNECTCQRTGEWACLATPCQPCIREDTGESYPPGDVYNDGCNNCTCQSSGEWQCTARACQCEHPVTGTMYDPGNSFQKDICNTCTCRSNGKWDCTEKDCGVSAVCSNGQQDGVCGGFAGLECPPGTTCNNTGECCDFQFPCCVNSGCSTGSGMIPDGEPVPNADPCEDCICNDGKVNCEKIQCTPTTTCTHPTTPTGECCPNCTNGNCLYEGDIILDAPVGVIDKVIQYLNSRVCEAGEETPNSVPCSPCTCNSGSVSCIAFRCAKPNCPNPITPPGECCQVCPPGNCKHGDTIIADGSRVPNPNNCIICTCEAGNINCDDIECDEQRCTHPAVSPGECCPDCGNGMCMVDSTIYNNGDDIPNDDPCKNCICDSGSEVCAMMSCEELDCPNPIPIDGVCCPICPTGNCEHEGTIIPNGEQVPNKDECIFCMCKDGIADCKKIGCRVPTCTHPVILPGVCCPDCDSGNCLENGNTYNDGDDVPRDNPCESCTCESGSIRCAVTDCAPSECPDPRQQAGVCCPVCPSDCQVNGQTFKNGEDIPNQDPCQTCTCDDGNEDCQTIDCPDLRCENGAAPVSSPDVCCDRCPRDCTTSGGTVPHGGDIPNQDPCQTCTCDDGSEDCQITECPDLRCDNGGAPVSTPDDVCCDRCPRDCEVRGQTYPHGSTVPGQCRTCTCIDGAVVDCVRILCPTLPGCPGGATPIVLPDECCPSCPTDCTEDGQTFPDGGPVPRDDPCQTCVCDAGTIQCVTEDCSQSSCSDPPPKPTNECCDDCTGPCFFNGADLENGQSVPGFECETCTCTDGSVNCDILDCPPDSCTHPLPTPCCPDCTGPCLFNNAILPNGGSVPGNNQCETCTCTDGSVNCVPVFCPAVFCSHPPPIPDGECCMDCSGDPVDDGDRCTECICRSGSVECPEIPCPPTNCNSPFKPNGECCEQCPPEGCQDGFTFREHGSMWDVKCNTCTCTDGDITCTDDECPGLDCRDPANNFPIPRAWKEDCNICFCRRFTAICEQKDCSGGSSECRDNKDRLREEGESWSQFDIAGTCRNCICSSGRPVCSVFRCPDVQDRSCMRNGQRFGHRRTWTEGQNDCSECECWYTLVDCYTNNC